MRPVTLRRVVALGVTCLFFVGLAGSSARVEADDPPPAPARAAKEVKTELPADKPKDDKAKDEDKAEKWRPDKATLDRLKGGQQVKEEAKVEMKKAGAPAKAGAKKADQGNIVDWLGAAVDKLVGNEAKPAPKPAPKAAVARPVQAIGKMAAPAGVARQFEQQYSGAFKQLYRSELHFMRLTCQPTRQQFDKVKADTDKHFKEVIQECATQWQEYQMGRQRANAVWPEPRKLVAKRMVEAVKVHVSPEMAATYQKELDLRDAARRRVAITNLVSAVDKRLLLTADQRDKLREVLEKNWNSSWGQMQLLMQDGQYFPMMPDDKIYPLLTESQKAVWRGIQKGNVFWGFELNMFNGVEMDDEVWPAEGDKK